MRHFAHSRAGTPEDEWHCLHAHLHDTGKRAECFVASFAPGWGHVAGKLHDAGKFQDAFQRMLRSESETKEQVDHSTVGALIARNQKLDPLAFVVAGHHTGLSNKQDLIGRLKEKAGLLDESRRSGLPTELEQILAPLLPSFIGSDKRKLALWIRMLFSALVDADRLDTERFHLGRERHKTSVNLGEMLQKLERRISQLSKEAVPTEVNAMRARVVAACRVASDLPPGAFTLTVPTGGGKTLSSMLFALRHAIERGLRRVIVVIPYTSITDQTAKTYRGIFGTDAVIEHHSAIDPGIETQHNKYSSENWDAPLIVTTSVQFFESLFSNKTSKCRKIHRITESVVVFDEVQTFPVGLLSAVCDVLKQLAGDYKTSLLLCTATQPALGIPGTREVIPDTEKEFAVVANRCEYIFPKDEQPQAWEEIADQIRSHERVLAIVSKRKDAEVLARLVGGDCLHLSARMCSVHRLVVLDEIKRREAGPLRVVATQLVEAGVDIDFPVVFRAIAGADSIAQAAGRCNREGKSAVGKLYVFFPPSEPPSGILQVAKQRTIAMWRNGRLDLRSPATFREYFRTLYGSVNTDNGTLAAERDLRFADVAELFRMIEPETTVVAPYGDSGKLVEELRGLKLRQTGDDQRALRRSLQRFAVQLRPEEVKRLAEAGIVEELDDIWIVKKGNETTYSERFGFIAPLGRAD